MARVICASSECRWNTKSNACKAKNVHFSWNFVNTKYQGQRLFWTCKEYEESEDYKEFLKRAEPYFEKHM